MDAVKKYKKRGVNHYRFNAIKQFAGEKILDVGCGSGAYVHKFQGEKDIYGCDYKDYDEWDENRELFKVCDACKLDYEDEAFDTLTAFEVMEHIKEPQEMLKEMKRVTRKNIILTVPNCDITEGMQKSNLLYSHWSDPTHINFYNLDSFKAEIEKAGFKIEEAYYINKVKPMNFVEEYLGVKNKYVKKFLQHLHDKGGKEHFITSLIVASK